LNIFLKLQIPKKNSGEFIKKYIKNKTKICDMSLTEDLPDSFVDESYTSVQRESQEIKSVESKDKGKIANLFDSAVVWALAHPFIAILIAVAPFLLLYAPAATIVFSVIGIYSGILLFLNAGIIYVYGMIDFNNNITYKKSIMYSIPITLILMFSSPLDLLWRYSGTLLFSTLLLTFAMPDTTFLKAMAASILMLLMDILFGYGIAIFLGAFISIF
jgi:hypothetical protein